MKFKFWLYFSLLLLIVGAFYGTHLIYYTSSHVNMTLNAGNMQTDMFLSNLTSFVKEHNLNRAYSSLKKAQNALTELKEDLDKECQPIIDQVIDKMRIIEEDLKNDALTPEDLDDVSAYALKSLTLIELNVAKKSAYRHQLENVLKAAEYAKKHLANAVEFIPEPDRVIVTQLAGELTELLKLKNPEFMELVVKLEDMEETLKVDLAK